MTIHALEVSGLRKSFGGLVAIDDVSFSVPAGKIVSVIGPNGAGKSTLFDLLTRVQDADGGAVVSGSQDLMKLPVHAVIRHGIARTFQHPQLIETGSVDQNIRVGRLRYRSSGVGAALWRSAKVAKERRLEDHCVNDLLQRMGLHSHRNAIVSATSTLVRQLTAIAMALASEPRILLLDEPLGGLVESEVQSLMWHLRQVQAAGVTILLIEHRMSAVMSLSDWIVVLNFGRRIAAGTPQEISRNEAVIDAYLGTQRAA